MNKYIKIVVAAIMIALSIYFFRDGNLDLGLIAGLLALISVLLYFINEYIILAFWQLRKQNMDGAKKWLAHIKNPNSQLRKGQIGYYHYLNGTSHSQDDLNFSEKEMRKAINHGLMFGHDRAIAYLNLATGMMRKGNKKEAQRLLKQARKEDKQGMVTSQIDMIEQQLKKVNLSKNPRQQQMQRRGRYY